MSRLRSWYESFVRAVTSLLKPPPKIIKEDNEAAFFSVATDTYEKRVATARKLTREFEKGLSPVDLSLILQRPDGDQEKARYRRLLTQQKEEERVLGKLRMAQLKATYKEYFAGPDALDKKNTVLMKDVRKLDKFNLN